MLPRRMSIATRRNACAALLLLFLALAFPAGTKAQTAANRIQAETLRLERLLATLKVSDEDRAMRAGALASVRQNLQAGNVYLALYRLQPLWAELSAQSYAASKAGVEAKGAEAFEAEWQRLKGEIEEKEKRLSAMPSDGSNAALDALIESSLTQVRPYYQSGRLYGLNTTMANGLFYMGLAPAYLDFSLFCRGLRLNENAKTLKLRPLAPELEKLEASILESYRRMDSSESQPQFIRLNSNLKMAAELEREGRTRGALLKYLETLLFLHLITAQPQVYAKERARLTEEARALELRMKSGMQDNSIALIFFESARSALSDAEHGKPDAERLKRARVLIDKVLPRYFEIVSGDK